LKFQLIFYEGLWYLEDMTPQVNEALTQVVKAMDGFNRAVELWIEDLQKTQMDPAKLRRLSGAARAMKDSSTIYLAWAEHLANGMPQEQGTSPPSEA